MQIRDLVSIFKRQPARGLVLCRPKGGLNDMLCQIEKCWAYSQAQHRHLLVDTHRSGFLDDFWKYFLPRDNTSVSFGRFDENDWPGSVRPVALTGRINQYSPVWRASAGVFADSPDGEPLTFDFTRRHVEAVLVHEQCGGGPLSLHALERMKLTPEVAATVSARLSMLGDYVAIHVRNTDFKTDYAAVFEQVAAQVPVGRVVLCTDDWNCQAYARDVFGERVLMSSNIPQTNGRRLHLNRQLDRYATNVDAIADLCVLAMGRQLFCSRHAGGAMSGYSQLARLLAGRRDVLSGLLG